MAQTPDQNLIRTFYGALSGKNALPLEPDSPFYVPILQSDPERDPILKLKTRIDFCESESLNLLTGFRGNGKSTELRRLKKLLEEVGCRVFLVNMLDYLIMSKPLELSDFILSLMTALAHATEAESGLDEIRKSYWERLKTFLNSEVQSEGLSLNVDTGILSTELGLKLKTDPIFKDKLQQRLRGHLTTMVEDARKYVIRIVSHLRKRENNPDLKVVLLVDSIEQLRGMGDDARQVHASVVDTFSGQAANLSFPMLHVVYTVPPYLIPLVQNVGRITGGHPIVSWPNVHVRQKEGSLDPHGLTVMQRIIKQRFPQWDLFLSEEQIRTMTEATGGDIRDFFRLIRECLVTVSNTGGSTISDEMIKQSKQQLLSDFLPIAIDDATWLSRIHNQKALGLDSIESLPRLARFFDNNLIMNYQNGGKPWYDIHPLIVEEVNSLTLKSAGSA
ncbi:MAG: hypothetical protein JW795_04105 [Chitinivibrionales bacterium]|nr:hypothetical protein [Chitinivibrionales bacterium]